MMSDASYRLIPWTLSALIISALPHALNLPLHISVLMIGLLIIRFFLHKKVLRMPPNWVKYAMAGVCVVVVLATFRTITGALAGGALLLCMATIKTYEMNTLRDHTALILAAFFIITSFVLDNNAIWVGLYVFIASGICIFVLLKISAPTVDNKILFKKAKLFFIYGLPLSIALFILFPRIPGPLWGVPNSTGKATTGISDSMSPGMISDLVKSDALAFRVKFLDKEPNRNQLYWRGPVLHHFDGLKWSAFNFNPAMRSSEQNSEFTNSGNIEYEVILEPHNQNWFYTLDFAQKLPSQAWLKIDYQVSRSQKISKLTRYTASSNLATFDNSYKSTRLLETDLKLPDGADKARALAQKWRNQNKSEQEIVQTALQMFNEELFSYTLSPKNLDLSNSVDDFLFNTKEGFCEHYASAFVVLMRAAGIPSRVVTGYLGGEKNTLNGYYRVKQSDAHAWAEVYYQDTGWTRVDPTGAIAPERIEKNLEEALPNENLGGFFSGNTFLLRLENSWYAINTAYFEWVLEFDSEKQMDLMKKLGFEKPDWRALVYILVGGVLLSILLMSFLFWRQSKNIISEPIQRLYLRFLQKLENDGLTIDSSEGPNDLSARASKIFPDKSKEIQGFINTYISARYFTVDENLDAIKQMKLQLKKI